jgi:hypothetical protein
MGTHQDPLEGGDLFYLLFMDPETRIVRRAQKRPGGHLGPEGALTCDLCGFVVEPGEGDLRYARARAIMVRHLIRRHHIFEEAFTVLPVVPRPGSQPAPEPSDWLLALVAAGLLLVAVAALR